MYFRAAAFALCLYPLYAHAREADPQDYYADYAAIQQQVHTNRATLKQAIAQTRTLTKRSPLSRFYQVLLQSQIHHPTGFEPYNVLDEVDKNWLKHNAPVLFYRHELLVAYNQAVAAHWKDALARLERIETFAQTADLSLYRDARATRGVFLYRLHYLDDALNEFSALIDEVPLLENKVYYGEGFFEHIELRTGHILSQLGQTDTAELLCRRSYEAISQLHHNVAARMQLLALDCLRHNALQRGDNHRFNTLNEQYKTLALDSQDIHSFVYALELQMRQLDTQKQYSDLLALYQASAPVWIDIAESYDGVSVQLVRLNALIFTGQLSLASSEIVRLTQILSGFPQWPQLANRLQHSHALLLYQQGQTDTAFETLLKVKTVASGTPLGTTLPPLVRSDYYINTLAERRMTLLQDSQRRTQHQLHKEQNINRWLLTACLAGALLMLTTIFLFYRQAQQKRQLSQLARYDSLTGVLSRRAASELIHTELSRSSRHKYPMSVSLLDLDHFKKINDAFGHDAGDQVLITFCQMVQDTIRSCDVFGRFGGEEFILCLPSTAPGQARQMMDRLLKQAASLRIESYPDIRGCGFSAGLIHISAPDNLAALVKQCDELLYTAKDKGRGCYIESSQSGGTMATSPASYQLSAPRH
ncbi:GGDEF domain-containing protein [Salinimonas lutimaris]|uniref:GGDEF domain-containing protein n=1 Tax=Salinimonas lutimaris TaxID=914153 RepID=UPI00158614CB|nr:GGDEF domain-containing protein [Salinimonas lutimaris]